MIFRTENLGWFETCQGNLQETRTSPVPADVKSATVLNQTGAEYALAYPTIALSYEVRGLLGPLHAHFAGVETQYVSLRTRVPSSWIHGVLHITY